MDEPILIAPFDYHVRGTNTHLIASKDGQTHFNSPLRLTSGDNTLMPSFLIFPLGVNLHIKVCFLGKIRKNISKCPLLKFLPSRLLALSK